MSKILKIISGVVVLTGLLLNVSNAENLILIPTGKTLSTGGVQAGYLSKFGDDGKVYFANIGVSRLEIQAAKFQDFSNGDDPTAISAQISVLPETTFTPALAVGIRDISNETNSYNSLYGKRSYYIAASKKVPITGGIPLVFQDVSLHGGIGTDSLSGVFFGIEGVLPMGLHLNAEYDTDDVNVGLTYKIIPTLKADLSYIKGDMYYGALFSTSF
jgi:hypothetical protein